MSLKTIIECNDTRRGRLFDLFVQGLIIASIITSAVETLPDLSQQSRDRLQWFEHVTVILFSIEYLLRVFVATPKRAYVLSFFGITDLLAILPFYISLGVDLRPLRAFRLLRLIRLFKLARYSLAVQRFHRALLIAREEIILFGFIAVILLYPAGLVASALSKARDMEDAPTA